MMRRAGCAEPMGTSQWNCRPKLSRMSWAWPYPSEAFSLVLSAYGRADGSPEKVLGIDMSTGARKKKNEKKKDRSKRKQPTTQPAPAEQQIHVVLWDEPPKRDPQENDTDLEPDLVRANPIGTSSVPRIVIGDMQANWASHPNVCDACSG